MISLTPSSKNQARFLLFRILSTIVIFRVLLTRVFMILPVHGNSMYPSLRDGDLCITYKLEPYTTSEVIAYRASGALRFGRIAAGENDTVEITQDEILLINGYQPAEVIFYPTVLPDELHGIQLTVNRDEWYLLNDCRTDLSDSRTYGSIPTESICGKVIFVIRRRGF